MTQQDWQELGFREDEQGRLWPVREKSPFVERVEVDRPLYENGCACCDAVGIHEYECNVCPTGHCDECQDPACECCRQGQP
jgi:hypothetical protein